MNNTTFPASFIIRVGNAMVVSAPWDTNGLAVEWTASPIKWRDDVPGGAVHLEDPPRDAMARQKKFEMPMSRNEIDGTLAALRVVKNSKPDEESWRHKETRGGRGDGSTCEKNPHESLSVDSDFFAFEHWSGGSAGHRR